MNNDAEKINAFLEICAGSLGPEKMDAVMTAVRQLVETRHLNVKDIVVWARPALA